MCCLFAHLGLLPLPPHTGFEPFLLSLHCPSNRIPAHQGSCHKRSTTHVGSQIWMHDGFAKLILSESNAPCESDSQWYYCTPMYGSASNVQRCFLTILNGQTPWSLVASPLSHGSRQLQLQLGTSSSFSILVCIRLKWIWAGPYLTSSLAHVLHLRIHYLYPWGKNAINFWGKKNLKKRT